MADQIAPVSWGVISTADIGLKKVIPAMQQGTLSRVDAIASRSRETADRAAADLGITTGYGSYEDLLADDSIEAVYIPLPNHLHMEWTVAAAKAGKHVLCEKPLAMSATEAQEMVDACDSAGVLLMEAFMYRLHPMWVAVVETVRRGDIGEVRSVETVFSYFNDDPGNIRNIPEVGGGALYDIGCYAVNVSRMVYDAEPTGVKASMQRDPALGTDVVTSAILDFDGRLATFVCSTQMEPDQQVAIHGTEGRIVVDIPFNIPPDRPTRFHVYAGGDPPVAPDKVTHEIPVANPYTAQAEALSKAIRMGSPAPIPPRDAVANMVVIDRIFSDAGD
ncbi:MAG TPA: Gfo/Idh/MocA family oxidoreductase [Acidimicrobiia bacterium]|nr:Gfo/Idh/MocA family oxidoreductase [Acidimicrobiia bacterium]